MEARSIGLDKSGYQGNISLISTKNICCGCASNEYTQHMVLWKNKEKKTNSFWLKKHYLIKTYAVIFQK